MYDSMVSDVRQHGVRCTAAWCQMYGSMVSEMRLGEVNGSVEDGAGDAETSPTEQ